MIAGVVALALVLGAGRLVTRYVRPASPRLGLGSGGTRTASVIVGTALGLLVLPRQRLGRGPPALGTGAARAVRRRPVGGRVPAGQEPRRVVRIPVPARHRRVRRAVRSRVPAFEAAGQLPLLRPLRLQRSAPRRAAARRNRLPVDREPHRPHRSRPRAYCGSALVTAVHRDRRDRAAPPDPRDPPHHEIPPARKRLPRAATARCVDRVHGVGPVVYSGSGARPLNWIFPNTYRAFALPLEQSFNRQVFGIRIKPQSDRTSRTSRWERPPCSSTTASRPAISSRTGTPGRSSRTATTNTRSTSGPLRYPCPILEQSTHPPPAPWKVAVFRFDVYELS